MKMRFIFLNILVIFQITTASAQSFGFVEPECGIVPNSSYYYQDFIYAHYAGYNLYHNGVIIKSGGVDYGVQYSGVLLRFINDSTGFFIDASMYGLTVYKIIGNTVTVIGGIAGYPGYNQYYYDFYVVNANTSYLVASSGHYLIFISKCSDIQTPKTIIADTSEILNITANDSIMSCPLCDNLSELNYLYYNGSDTLDYKIILQDKDSTCSRKVNTINWLIFPNPTTGIFALTLPEKATIEISDINGQIIMSNNFDKGEILYDISKFSGGVYFIRAKTGKGIIIKKIIKK